ncbi:MAG: FAD-binding oxidoreductase [Bacteroidota bacterium]
MNSSKTHNEPFLIIGQGVAGTLLAYFLIKEKYPFKVIDKPMEGASSSVAAGIINPVTGRRLVKSWRFDEISRFAQSTYLGLGSLLGGTFYHKKTILRALKSTFEENEWMRRSGFAEYRSYLSDSADLGSYHAKVTSPHSWGEIKGAAKLDMPELIYSFRSFLKSKNLLIEKQFDYQDLRISNDSVEYQGEQFKKVIFCEGAKAIDNPYFDFLPFSPTKGEIFIVKIDDFQAQKLLKNKIYICPLHSNRYWVGSTNSFDFEHVHPTSHCFNSLKKDLEELLLTPFEIITHKAGIRPTVSDKRPLLGVHPNYKSLYIFNGLGTKGASLGPFFANQMVQFLQDRTQLDVDVNITRFNVQKRNSALA